MKRMVIIVSILAVVLLTVVSCLYLTPMHRERPGTNREALGTITPADTTEPVDGLNPEAILDGPDGTSTHAFKGTQHYNKEISDTIKTQR